MTGGGLEAGAKGVQLVARTGRIRCGGDADSGSGGGMDGGGGGDGWEGDRDRLSQGRIMKKFNLRESE